MHITSCKTTRSPKICAIRFLGPNKSLQAITRIGRAIGTVSPILDNFDEVNQVSQSSSSQRQPNDHKDTVVIVKEMVKADCFVMQDASKRRQKISEPHGTFSWPKTEKN